MRKTGIGRGKKIAPVREEQRITTFFNKLAVQKVTKSSNKIVSNNEASDSDNDFILENENDKIKSNIVAARSKVDKKIKWNEEKNSLSPGKDEECISRDSQCIIETKIEKSSKIDEKIDNYIILEEISKKDEILSDITENTNYCKGTKQKNSTPNSKNLKKRTLEIDSPDIIPSTPQEIAQKICKNKSKIYNANKDEDIETDIIIKHFSSPPSKKPCNIPHVDDLTAESTSNISPSKSSLQKIILLKNPISPSKLYLKSKRSLFEAQKVKDQYEMLLNNKPDDFFNDDWDVDMNQIEDQLNELNLETWQYCKILEVSRDNFQNIILKIQSLESKKQTLCILQGIWQYSILQPDDIINILAIKHSEDIPFCINNDEGFLIFEPDLMISPTSIVASQFCKRRGILSEKFRGFEPENKVMIVGTLVHKLLQDVLKKEIYRIDLVEKQMNDILSSREMMNTLYSSRMSLEEIKNELSTFVPKIVNFVENYVRNNGKKTRVSQNSDNWQGKIQTIQDIEENIWSPQLGIKGKIDITVKTDRFGNILPLELKTGKASMSPEHRGQVAFYIMMMMELGYQVSSGLLLYLREEVLKEVKVRHVEKRDLLMLRNEFTYYLKQKPRIPEGENNLEEKLKFAQLPEPINHHSACGKCPYSNICTVLLSREETYTLSENHPLHKISEECLQCLKPSHIDYFIHWSSLLTLESTYKPPLKEIKDIWRLPPYKREMRGKSLCYLKISTRVTELKDCFSHTLSRNSDQKIADLVVEKGLKNDFTLSGLSSGNYIVISTDTRTAVATGFITDITSNFVTVSLERDLNERYSNKIFHIDTYESQQIVNFSRTSVAALLDSTERASKLRELIIDRRESEISGELNKSVITKGASILKKLNKIQQRAVLKALTIKDYLLIKGMPGTGKTATIVALVQLLVKLDKTVLITSHTHSAVDNVCLRLLQNGVDFLRLGNENRVHPLLKHRTESVMTAHCTTVEEMREIYNNMKVIAVTCLGASHPILNQRTLDFCIVDESTQVIQCTALKALLSCDSFILIGDPDQLPPIVRNPEAVRRGMNESLFERLDNLNSTITLTLQYRMNKTITDLANSVTYKGELLCGNDSIASAVLNLPNFNVLKPTYENQQWIIDILNLELESSVVAVDTGPTWLIQERNENNLLELQVAPQNVEEDEERKCSNNFEACFVVSLIQALKLAGLDANSVGIIAPYRDQVNLLKKLLTNTYENNKPEVNTVDQYQGRDKEVIIYSCTRSRDISKIKNRSGFEILDDKRRLTVAITRAKHKLVIVGDFQCLREYSPFENLLDSLQNHQKIDLNTEKYGFSWEEMEKYLVK